MDTSHYSGRLTEECSESFNGTASPIRFIFSAEQFIDFSCIPLCFKTGMVNYRIRHLFFSGKLMDSSLIERGIAIIGTGIDNFRCPFAGDNSSARKNIIINSDYEFQPKS